MRQPSWTSHGPLRCVASECLTPNSSVALASLLSISLQFKFRSRPNQQQALRTYTSSPPCPRSSGFSGTGTRAHYRHTVYTEKKLSCRHCCFALEAQEIVFCTPSLCLPDPTVSHRPSFRRRPEPRTVSLSRSHDHHRMLAQRSLLPAGRTPLQDAVTRLLILSFGHHVPHCLACPARCGSCVQLCGHSSESRLSPSCAADLFSLLHLKPLPV